MLKVCENIYLFVSDVENIHQFEISCITLPNKFHSM